MEAIFAAVGDGGDDGGGGGDGEGAVWVHLCETMKTMAAAFSRR
jgi:GTPase involved in cell partitioning and DNA repair